MPHLVSSQTKRFKKWLLRFKTGKFVGHRPTGIEVLSANSHSQPLHVPVALQVARGTLVETLAGAKEDTVDTPSTARAVVSGGETDEGPNLPLLASWTCSRWREVVLNTPTLWSTVCLGVYGAGLPEILLRSGGCSIDFILDSTSAESIAFPRDVSGLLAILEPYYCRIRSLNLVLPDQDCVETTLAQICGAVPNLQSLELSLPYDPCSGMQIFAPALAPDIANSFGVIGCGSGEKLQVLKLQAVNFPWYDNAFSHLTTLRLASMCTEETMIVWEQLTETLMRNGPTLEELSLDQCDFCVEDESLSFPVVTLPQLKYLHLRLVDPGLIAMLLSHTSMPALETLELEFDPDDQCEVFRALFPSTSTCPEQEPAKSLSRVRSLAIQGGAYQADLVCEIIGRMPDLERLMLGGCIVTAAIIRTLSLPRVARKLTDMWLELCENYCAFDLQRLARARCGGVRVHEIGSAGQAPLVIDSIGDVASLKYLERTNLDESLYDLDANELRFFQLATDIRDPAEIKQHILSIQAEAFKAEEERNTDNVLVGNDARKAALDGYPLENIVATDLRRGKSDCPITPTQKLTRGRIDFWDLGFKLFKDDPALFPVPFLEGDIFSSQLLDLDAPRPTERPKVPHLKTLTELLGRVSIIHASAFFHLFSEENQKKLAERCVALLNMEPGSTIFGSHNGAPEPGVYTGIGAPDREMFCHSPESWRKLWMELFGDRRINVMATLEGGEAGAKLVGASAHNRPLGQWSGGRTGQIAPPNADPLVQLVYTPGMKVVLVVGATGQQGSSVIATLSDSGDYLCLALTRNPNSQKDARSDPSYAIWGVFVALEFPGLGVNTEGEERQGKNIATVAWEFRVQSYIFSSAVMASFPEDKPPIPGTDHYAKMSIEKHVSSLDIPWTIVRIGFLMENFNTSIAGRFTNAAIQYCMSPEVKLQLTVNYPLLQDIGSQLLSVLCYRLLMTLGDSVGLFLMYVPSPAIYLFEAIDNSELCITQNPLEFNRETINVAIEGLKAEELNQVFIQATGYDIPSVPRFVMTADCALGRIEGFVQADDLRKTDLEGYNANIQKAAGHMKLTTFEEWAQRFSQMTPDKVNEHQITVWGLLTGKA
ncbi:NmrA domain-containing protein [Rhizoctonia solani AG-1 IA]|uniref:NmrA domain-containing protein n=1 Tax=Thanatephorus cucumeris (strain AG1-IA) TaxID=983506 RepID=L8WTE5_THACA|nr:NmrA domain-containing protein [Rhizoctonia solani AG-1 IA]